MNDNHDNIKHFKDLEYHITTDTRPAVYLNEISKQDFFNEYPFSMLGDLKKIGQSPVHHPEGNVWNHTMMVLDNAAALRSKSKNPVIFMWSALLHDLGKVPATKIRKGRITAYDHDRYGEELAYKFLNQFTDDVVFIKSISYMVRWHMQILYVLKGLPFANIKKMLDQVSLDEIALLSFCDRTGRGGLNGEKIDEEKNNITVFIDKCKGFIDKNHVE